MKRGPKASSRSSWEKRSLELEAEVGDDSEAYNVNEDELEELLIDDDMPGDDRALTDDEILELYGEDEEDEETEDDAEDPLLHWDDELEDYV